MLALPKGAQKAAFSVHINKEFPIGFHFRSNYLWGLKFGFVIFLLSDFFLKAAKWTDSLHNRITSLDSQAVSLNTQTVYIRRVHPPKSVTIAAFHGEKGES